MLANYSITLAWICPHKAMLTPFHTLYIPLACNQTPELSGHALFNEPDCGSSGLVWMGREIEFRPGLFWQWPCLSSTPAGMSLTHVT